MKRIIRYRKEKLTLMEIGMRRMKKIMRRRMMRLTKIMMKTNKTILFISKDYNNNKNTTRTRTRTNFTLIKKKLKVVYLHVIH